MRQNGIPDQQARWKQLEALLGTKLPSLPTDLDMSSLADISWVEDYVKQMLKKTMPASRKQRGTNATAEVFETHNYVIIKLKLPKPVNPIVKVSANNVSIEDNPDFKRQTVQLPCLIIPRSSRASHKNGILQIKLRKRKINKTSYDVNVRYL